MKYFIVFTFSNSKCLLLNTSMYVERYQFFCQKLVISFYQKVILKRKREHSTLNFVFLIEMLCEGRRKEEM